MSWKPEVEELRRREELGRAMGGPEKIKRQHDGGKLTVRERVAALLDLGSFHEVGVLAEIYRNCSVKRVCQVDIADNYEHKHQDLSQGDPSKGLMKMAVDIAKTIFRILSAEGVALTTGMMQTLLVRFIRMAEDTITRYHADAMINNLIFDRHEEETAVETFAQALRLAGEEFFADPLGNPSIPNWNRISAALPGFLGALREAVDADNAELAALKREPAAAGRG